MKVVIGLLCLIIVIYLIHKLTSSSKSGGSEGYSGFSAVAGVSKTVIRFHYANWCGYCKALMPKWYSLTKELASNPQVTMAMVNEGDGMPSDPNYPRISGYPTIVKETSNAGKRTYEVYGGAREIPDMRAWILKGTSSSTVKVGSQQSHSGYSVFTNIWNRWKL